jgi:rhomboid domain-containing protein 1
MMTLWSLGGTVERTLGTICFLGLNLAILLLSNLIYLLCSYVAFKATDDDSWLSYCSVGYSGVLFGLTVVETKIGDRLQPRNLFGFSVPAVFYPWALLILLQIMMPGISFIGHLSGILVGLLYVSGCLPWLSLKRQWILQFERRFVDDSEWRSFIKCPSQSQIPMPSYQMFAFPVNFDH